ncbi:MAG: alpha/beta fold hydrolase [Litorilinea sp.]
MLQNRISMQNSRRLVLLLVTILALSACKPITAPEPALSTPTPGEESGLEAEPESEADADAENVSGTPEAAADATPVADEQDAGQAEADAAQAVTLLPHTDEQYGIESVTPEGWVNAGNGIFARQSHAEDVTIIVQQAAPVDAETVLNSILPQLLLTEPPESVGTIQSPALDWTLYEVAIDTDAFELQIDMALAETGGVSYLLLLQAPTEEYEALHNAVFLPTLDQFAPLEREISQEDVPYLIEDVTFENENADVTLAGTLTLPPTDGPHPVVVLVSGSGPQNRDSVIAAEIAIAPFRLLADALTRQGIGVLRYDDRGVGESTGDFVATEITDFAEDAEAAIDFLRTHPDIDPDGIGLLGHSEGGMVAAILGSRNEDLDFIIALAGPGVRGDEVLILQNQLVMEAEGATQAEIEAQVAFVREMVAVVDDPEAIEALTYAHTLTQLEALPEEEVAGLEDLEQYARIVAAQAAQQYSAGWFRSFLEYDAASDWAQTTVPVLAVYGGKDVQVDAEQNATAVEAALQEAGNTEYEIVILPDANHLFQAADTGAISEYSELAGEFTPNLVPTLIEWLYQYVTVAESPED